MVLMWFDLVDETLPFWQQLLNNGCSFYRLGFFTELFFCSAPDFNSLIFDIFI
jgi:hypothetical protein